MYIYVYTYKNMEQMATRLETLVRHLGSQVSNLYRYIDR